MTLTLLAIANGLAIGAVYGMIAIGYSVVYRATRIFNLAQGDLVILGVMLSWYLQAIQHWPQWATVPAVLVAATVASLLEERLVVRPVVTRTNDHMAAFIATLACSLIISTIVINLYGNRQPEPIPSLINGSLRAGSVAVSNDLILAFATLLVIAAIIEIFYRRTWIGVAMRAVSENPEVATLRGIDSNRMRVVAFAIGGVVAGVAGVVVGPIVSANPQIGLSYGLKGFVAMALGGFGSIRGAVVGALLLGVAEQLLDRFYTSQYEILADALALVVVLVFKPTGLFSSLRMRAV